MTTAHAGYPLEIADNDGMTRAPEQQVGEMLAKERQTKAQTEPRGSPGAREGCAVPRASEEGGKGGKH